MSQNSYRKNIYLTLFITDFESYTHAINYLVLISPIGMNSITHF